MRCPPASCLERKTRPLFQSKKRSEGRLLYAFITASAGYGLISAWIMGKLDKTPEELGRLIVDVFGTIAPQRSPK